jgi:O-antigen/teichoic acid export membrane protein
MSEQTVSSSEVEKSRVAAGAGLVSIARIIGGIFNLLTIVILTRLLDQAVFALVGIVYMIQETIVALGSLDLHSALFYFIPKLGNKAARSLGTWTGICLLGLSIPFAAALWFGGPLIAELTDKPGLAVPLAYLAIFLIADFPGQAAPFYLLGRKSYVGFFLVTILFYASRFASLVVPAAMGASIEGIMFWFVGVAILRLAVFIFLLTFVDKNPIARQGWKIADLFSYGVPLSLSSIVGKLSVQIDKYMIMLMCTAEAFAVYYVGAIELPLVPSLAYSVTAALLPTLVVFAKNKEISNFIEYWHGSVVKVASVMMPVFFFFFILAGPLMRLLFSSQYEEAAIPFRVYLCLLPLRLCAYGAVVRSLGRTKPVLYASIAALSVNVLLNYPFFVLFGIAGPAMASIIAQLVAIVWLLRTIKVDLSVSWGAVFPYLRVAKAFGVAGLAAIPLIGIDFFFDGDISKVATGTVIFVATYLGLGRLSNVITRNDLVYLLDFVSLRVFKKAQTGKDMS